MIRRVLLVEDEDAHAELIQRQLRAAAGPELTVDRASTLAAALDRIEAEEPDAVLLDLGLPDTDREETLALFVASAPHLPLVVLTSEGDASMGASAVAGGADDFLVKSGMNGSATLRALRYSVERKRNALALMQYAEQLEQSNDSLRQFSHLLAHELKQPLNPILLNCAVLRRELGEGSSQAKESIEDIESAVRDMAKLVNDMLAFASISAVRTPEGTVDVDRLVRELVERLGPEIQASGAEVRVAKLPRLRAHEALLRQLFQNLLVNALKYGRERDPHVEVRVEEHADHYRFEVADDGIGIAPEHQARVFEMFKRVPGGRKVEGSGIGLALARMIVEHHGGTIGLVSEPGRGATFWFRLPRTPHALEASESRTESCTESRPEHRTNGDPRGLSTS